MNELTKQDYETAIGFLNTLKEENFVKDEQTYQFDPVFIGKKHCVLGQLYVNPASPFFDRNNLSNSRTTSLQGDPSFNTLRHDHNSLLSYVNNTAPDNCIKRTVINALVKEMDYRFK